MRQKDVAAELGVASKTVQRWVQREDVRELIRKQREALVGELDSPEEVCRAALSATRRDGSPDWSTRLRSADILLRSRVATPEAREEAREVEFHLDGDGDVEELIARPHPLTAPDYALPNGDGDGD